MQIDLCHSKEDAGELNVKHFGLLLQIAKTFKDQQVLKDISWDVKRGERVGLVGRVPPNFCSKLFYRHHKGVLWLESCFGSPRPTVWNTQDQNLFKTYTFLRLTHNVYCFFSGLMSPSHADANVWGTWSDILSMHAGVNGAGKTTQLQIITGGIEADDGEILKQKANMKIAYLTQEFDVVPSRTVRVGISYLLTRRGYQALKAKFAFCDIRSLLSCI